MTSHGGMKNGVKLRLTGAPEGNLLVSFYFLDITSPDAVNGPIAQQLVDGRLRPGALRR